jgi:HlyD family secretion protein
MTDPTALERLTIPAHLKRPPSVARKFLRFLPWAVGLGLVVVFLAARPYAFPMSVDAQSVKVLDPEVTTSAAVLTVTGYVVPRHRVEIAPKIIGRVARVHCERGDRVTSGQLLVELDDGEYSANRDRARAAVMRAQAELDRLRAGFRVEEIAESKAQVALSRAAARDSSQSLERAVSLVQQRAEGAQFLDRARNNADQGQARLLASETRLALMLAGNRDEDIRVAEANLLEAQAAHNFAEIQWQDTRIRSPIHGTVMERLVEPGEMVTNAALGGSRGARTALVSVADLRQLEVEIDLNQLDLGRVRLEQNASIGLEAHPGVEWPGRVDRMAPEANRQKATVQVKVAITEPDDRIRPEMTARVTLLEPLNAQSQASQKAEKRLFVLPTSIVQRDSRPVVFVLRGQKAAAVPIVRGEETPDGVRIMQGLQAGDQVVVTPPDNLKDGLPVRLKAKS